MATAHLLPIYRTITGRILRRRVRSYGAGEIRIVEGFELFCLALSCPFHSWTWPRANRDERMGGYDAHQTCHKCMSRRMFDTRAWRVGPIYKRESRG